MSASDTFPIDTLSRAELLLLIKRFIPLITAREVAVARWLAASDDWRRASERLGPIREAWTKAREAHEARPSSIKALGIFQEANLELERAELAASRAWSRSCRLYDALPPFDAGEAA
jgi:hypothetical protein